MECVLLILDPYMNVFENSWVNFLMSHDKDFSDRGLYSPYFY